MKETIRRVIEQEAQAVLNIPVGDSFEKAIELIFERVHQQKGKLVASGMGKAGQIAANIATTFSSTGTPAVFLHPSDSQHGDLGVVQQNDVLLFISNSGRTREIRNQYISSGISVGRPCGRATFFCYESGYTYYS